MAYHQPSHPPPPRQDSNGEAFADAEPPPPYSSIATDSSTTLEANFSRPYEVQDSGAFSQPSGPPPRPAQPSPSPPQRPQQHHHPIYAPPPGLPPRAGGSSSSASASAAAGAAANATSNPPAHIDGVSSFNRPALPNQVPAHTAPPQSPSRAEAYSPTVNPTSGQPLLRKGRMLIYPRGFYCPKCHNTGYKAYDPSVPHERCWEKYGRQYTSILRNSPDFNFQNPTLQKPLPNARYTSSTGYQLPPQSPPPGSQFANPPQPHPGYYVAGQAHPPPGQQYPLPPSQPMYHSPPIPLAPQARMVWGAPPPGALVVRPGDPRIGGRLCPECGGRGQVECGFLFLDTETCRACNGTGRVFF